MQNLRFSGHETFICRQLWPKKGYDFLIGANDFNNDDSVVKLGVGKNMVLSIKYWMKSMGLTDDEGKLADISEVILSDQGYDPYLEDIGSIWLLHYCMVSLGYASLYNIVFNEYAKGKTEFTKAGLLNFVKRLASNSLGNSYNEKTVSSDINVLLRNYIVSPNESITSNVEDEYFGLFTDLDLIKHLNRNNTGGKKDDYYLIERNERNSLPLEIFLFAILKNELLGNNISFNELVSGNNSVGNVFLMNRDGIYQKIEELTEKYDFITFSQTAGVPLLQFEKKPNPIDILASYYEN